MLNNIEYLYPVESICIKFRTERFVSILKVIQMFNIEQNYFYKWIYEYFLKFSETITSNETSSKV